MEPRSSAPGRHPGEGRQAYASQAGLGGRMRARSLGGARGWALVVAAVLAMSTLGLPGRAVMSVAADEGDPEYLSWAKPGPYRSPFRRDFDIQSFGADQKIVATYFFYWYDAATYRAGQQTR